MNQTNQTDERKGMVSCSILPRIFACPKSFKLEQMVLKSHPRLAEEDTADADKGTALHSIMERYDGSNEEIVPPADADAIHFCHREYLKVAESYEANGIKFEKIDEQRLWAHGMLSGKMDRLLIAQDQCDIFDWKFGVQPVTGAGMNLQTAGYAYLVMENYPDVKTVNVHVISPNAMGERTSHAMFKREDFIELQNRVLFAVMSAMGDNAPYAVETGSHCQFCKAKGICEVQAGMATELCYKGTVKGEVPAVLGFGKCDITVSNAREAYHQIKAQKSILNTLNKHLDYLMLMVEDVATLYPDECGLCMEEGNEVLLVKDVPLFIASLVETLGVSYEDLVNADIYKIKKSNLDKLLKERGIKASQIKAFYNNLHGCEFVHQKDKIRERE